MRATSPAQPGAVADAVWDELLAGHVVVASGGYELHDIYTKIGGMYYIYTRRTPYTYSGGLAAGAFYVPAAGSWLTVALLSEADKLEVYHATLLMLGTPGATLHGFFIDMHADGTNLKFKNTSGVERVLDLYGVTL